MNFVQTYYEHGTAHVDGTAEQVVVHIETCGSLRGGHTPIDRPLAELVITHPNLGHAWAHACCY